MMRSSVLISTMLLTSILGVPLTAGQSQSQTDEPSPVYRTYGAHNPAGDNPQCTNEDCKYPRKPGEPSDPLWPIYWQSNWHMYRIYKHYESFPPPYDGAPPEELIDGTDYQVSTGASFYDSTYRGPWGERAMEERYDDFCLPIFPMENDFSCRFVSVGDKAFFFADEGRPHHVPAVCLFSPLNYAPARDFISHLPYSAADSRRIGPGGQGYSFWVSGSTGDVVQVGAYPDRTADQAILFGYGFQPNADGKMQPQSFYFSGYPLEPAYAPIVSQNYIDFEETQPASDRWKEVEALDIAGLETCNLFAQHDHTETGLDNRFIASPLLGHPTWAAIGRWKRESED